MPRRSKLLPAWIALMLLAAPHIASAQAKGSTKASAGADATTPSAQKLYAEAQKLFDKGSYADALVAFRQAYNVSSSPNARLMVGHCLVALGRRAEAYEEMTATMREAAKKAETESKYGPTRDTAATQLALLEPNGLNVLTIHAEVEGIVCQDLFRDFLKKCSLRGIEIVPLCSLIEGRTEFPDGTLKLEPMQGREGWVAQQG